MNLIIFDIDGTLTDTIPMYRQAFIDALRLMGVQKMDDNFKAYKHHTDSYIGKVIYEKESKKPFTQDKLNRFEDYLTEIVEQAYIQEIAGAKKLIERLQHDPNVALGYATGSFLRPAAHKLLATAIPYRKESLVASNHIHERENIVSRAIAQASDVYGVKTFERIISVGDGLWDLTTARNLNIEFVGIGQENKDIMYAHGMEHYLDDLTGFYESYCQLYG